MLKFVAKERPGLEAIQYFVCRAYRRAHRIQGLRGITHARRLGLDSALRAPSWCLPDTDLSKYMDQVLQPRLRHWLMRQREGIIRANIAILKRLHSLCAGYRSIRRWMAPENIVYGFETLYRNAAIDGSSRKWT